MAKLSIRIDLAAGQRLGPGKIALLEKIDELGSISAAGRAMAMSYRRAWLLVAELNAMFAEPLVSAQMGGRRGGGAALTRLGGEVVAQYRSLEREVAKRAAPRLRIIERSLPAEAGAAIPGTPEADSIDNA